MYVDVDSCEVGPLSTAQLQERLVAGKCMPHTLVHSMTYHTTLSAQRALEARSLALEPLGQVWQSRFATAPQLREMLDAAAKRPLGKRRLGPVLLPVSADLDDEDTLSVHQQVKDIGLLEAIFNATLLYYELKDEIEAEAAAEAAAKAATRANTKAAAAAARQAKADPPRVAPSRSLRAEAPAAAAAEGLPEVRKAFKAAVCDVVQTHIRRMGLAADTFKRVAASTVRKATDTMVKNGNMGLWRTGEAAVSFVRQEKEVVKLRKLAVDYVNQHSSRGPAALGASRGARGGQENDGYSDGHRWAVRQERA